MQLDLSSIKGGETGIDSRRLTLAEFGKELQKAGDGYEKAYRGTSYIPSHAGLSPNRVRKSLADGAEEKEKGFKPYLAKFERVRAKTQRRPLTEFKPKKKTKSVVEERIMTVMHETQWEYTIREQEAIDKRCWRMLRYLERLELALH